MPKKPNVLRDSTVEDDSLDTDGMTALEGEGGEQERRPRGPRNNEDRDIDAFMAELGDEAEFVQLRRYDNSVSDWVILGKIDASEATAEGIKARYGGGKYRARVIDREGIHGKMITFRLAGKPKNEDGDEDENAKALRDRIAQLERTIAEKGTVPETGRTANDRLMEAIVTRLLAPPVVPTRDPLMETLITALLAGKPSSGGIDPIKLQELLADARRDGYEQGKELGEALSLGDNNGDGSVASVLAHQLPKLTEIITNAQTREGTRRRIAPAKANPPATPLPETPHTIVRGTEGTSIQPEQPVNTNPIAKYLAPVVPTIMKWARSGKTPEVKAVNMIDDLTDQQKDTIGGLAEREDFVESVMSAVPEFNSPDVKAWVESFLATVQDTLAPAADESVPEMTTEVHASEEEGETTTEA